jgi:nitrite reductase/ring-hydroxylating ferredoxin subunit
MNETADTNTNWRVVAQTSALGWNGLFDVVVDDQLVLLVNTGEEIIAVQGQCPHQFARLVGGSFHENRLQCPHHRALFRLSDGACTNGWQLPPLKRYPVRVIGSDIALPRALVAMP